MKCKYDADGECASEAATGSLYCEEHPLDDLDFYLRAISVKLTCPRCGGPVPDGFFFHDCPPGA
ncbi:hypothetical protein [Streptomyces sp. NPDC059828]|uniref:hypothetical protein n=1 Tax=Streptomyces sp. NPDC059828 TaxID=3346965 RepID=UPI00365FD1FF